MAEAANRRVIQIDPKREARGGVPARILDYLDRDLIVLLGDPGAGKTYSFQMMAAAEQAQICSVRVFVARNGDVQARTVYLDGLDEYRPQTADSNLAITLLQILRKSGSPRLRLSCRFADWLGRTDLELFKDYCSTGSYAVLALEPLDHQEALAILVDKGVSQPEVFLAEATARRIVWQTQNPQKLLMLAEVVSYSGWPVTTRDLYEQWSLIHLEEHKESLQRTQLGQYAAAELVDPAGAACAAVLISDAAGIRRGPSSDDLVPSYRSVPGAETEAVLAALSRPAFSSVGPDIATYVHRTIAEYLGARWLGKQVDAGLPLSRLQALVGVDCHPSPSLRGLHAWLPVFVPLQAASMISNDPIGVLTYGDAASLPASHRIDLIKAIGALAAENAWFLAEGLSDYGLAGLSCPETAEHLLAILRSPAEPPSLKTLALRAIEVGEPLARYRPELENILADSAALSSHRKLAFRSLLKYGLEGTGAVVRIYATAISGEGASISLRSSIVGELYGRPFSAADAVAILIDAATKSPAQTIGEIWPLVHGIPAQCLLDVLEEYDRQSSRLVKSARNRQTVDVPLSVGRMVGRVYETVPEDDGKSIDRLITALCRISEQDLSLDGIRIGDILDDRPGLVRMLIDSAVRHMDELEHPRIVGLKLHRITGGAATMKATAERLNAEFEVEECGPPFPPNMLERYEAFGRCLYSLGPERESLLERFVEIGKSRPECKPILETYTKRETDEGASTPSPYAQAVAEYHLKVRSAVESQLQALGRGENLGLQGELAKLYFGFYSGESEFTRRKQLVLALGDSLTEAVERGFAVLVDSQAPPTLQEIAKGKATDKLYWHFYAYLAGMDLLWEQRQALTAFSREALSSGFALSLILDTPEKSEGRHATVTVRDWPQRILRERPEICEEVYSALLTECLSQGANVSTLLNRLHNEAHAPWRGKLALQLLLNHEPTAVNDLQELVLMAAESDDGRPRLAAIAQQRVLAPAANRPAEDTFWIVAGFVLAGESFEPKLAEAASKHAEMLWTIRSLTRLFRPGDGPDSRFDLGLRQMEFIVRTFGPLFPKEARPSSYWGDQNNFEASLYLNDVIASISTRPEFAAGESLARLLQDPALAAFHLWTSSRLTAQREVNRQSRYQKPGWNEVCATLARGAPANVEDLKALFLADLVDAVKDIRQSNTDKYRVYWGGGRYSLGTPRDEDYCRDRLVDYLRLRLKPLDIWVEPEGHMAADKRADIALYAPNGLKLPVEVKRATHQDLWIAPRTQLERLYTRDPNAQGYGVYLVFYFGPARGRGVTPHPDGVSVPDSPDDIRRALDAAVPAEHRSRIACSVVDVSPPASRSSASGTRRKSSKREAASSKKKSSPQARPSGASKKSALRRAPKKGH